MHHYGLHVALQVSWGKGLGCLIPLYDCRRDEGAVQILRLAGSTSNRLPLWMRPSCRGLVSSEGQPHSLTDAQIKIPTLVEVSTNGSTEYEALDNAGVLQVIRNYDL
jgi:hypothetical protein